MEDTLRVLQTISFKISCSYVLILVLMEDTLRGLTETDEGNDLCLNPCFNGRYSQRHLISYIKEGLPLGLNPCFNGRYSQRAKTGVTLFIVV